jgi:hypothetical protein
VTTLLGNHEVMNLTGDLAYASPGEIAAFAGEETRELRASARARLEALVARPSPLIRSSFLAQLGRDLGRIGFDAMFPPGSIALRREYSSDGRLGRWLEERPVVHVEAASLFVHAGLSPAYAALPVETINRRVKDDLAAYRELVERLESAGVFDGILGSGELWRFVVEERRAGGPAPALEPLFRRAEELFRGPLFATNGPVWYRGLAEAAETAIARDVERLVRAQSVARIVIGHTQPRGLRIAARCRARILLIDTGMNQRVYGGTPSALVFEPDGRIRAFEIGR